MKNDLINIDNIQSRIFTIRGIQIMIDRDLAELYNVEVKRLNEQVKRNIERFPNSFRFQLTDNEKNELVANCDRFSTLKHSSVNPYAFTEQGVAMLSAVLRSETAVNVSIQIMQAFVDMKKFIANNAGIFQRLDKVEQKQIQADKNFHKLFKALEDKSIKPNQGIFFNGQVFDAYKNNGKLKMDNGQLIVKNNSQFSIINYQLTEWFAFSKMDASSVTILNSISEML